MSDQIDAKETLNHVMGIFSESLELTRKTAEFINSKAVPDTVMDHYGISLFNRMYTTSVSIMRLLPLDINDMDVYLSYNSIISLSRTLIDCSLTLFYLWFDKVDFNTRKLRFVYTSLYGLKNEFDAFNRIEHYEKASAFLKKFKTNKKLICASREYIDLSEKEVKEKIKDFEKSLKNNHQFYGYCKKEKLYKNMGYMDVSTFRLAQYILSTFVHSSPSSICSKDDSIQERYEWAMRNISFALTISSAILAHSTRDFIKKIINKNKFIYAQLSEQDKAELDEIIQQITGLIKIINPNEEWVYKKLKIEAEEFWA